MTAPRVSPTDFLRSVLQPRRTWSYHLRKPMLAALELTHRCNLRCEMCNLWRDYQGHRPDELSLDEWMLVVDGLAKLGTREVRLIGAEPLLHPNVSAIAAHVTSKGMRCVITTNGVLLAAHAAALVAASVSAVQVSVDGPAGLHDQVRGVAGTFERAQQGIQALLAARSAAGSREPFITVSTTISATNVDSVGEMGRLSQALGADAWHFNCLVEVPGDAVVASKLNGATIGSTRFTAPPDQSHLLKASQIHMLRRHLQDLPPSSVGSARSLFNSLPDSTFSTARIPIRRCYTLRTRIIVNPYGNVIPCPFLDGYAVGNVKTDALDSIWRGRRYGELRRAIERKLLPICRYCCYFPHNMTPTQSLGVALGRALSMPD